MTSLNDKHPATASSLADTVSSQQANTGLELRQQAEELLQGKAAQSLEQLKALSPEALNALFHELQVHQIELELQNEELRQAQQELATAKAHYFDLYDLAPVGYLTVTHTDLISQANLAAATLLGLPRQTLLTKLFSYFILNEDLALYYHFFKRLVESNEAQVLDLRMLNNGGIQFWAHLEASTVQDADGVASLRITLTNITALINTEMALRESDQFKHAILNSMTSQIAVLDCNGIIVAVNKSWRGFVLENGIASDMPERLTSVGCNYLEVCLAAPLGESSDQGQEAYRGIMTILEGRLPHFSIEYACHSPTQQRWFMMSATPLDMEKGGVVIVHTNITERKLYERLLNQHKVMLDVSMDGFWIVDLTGNLLQVNQAYANISGYSVDELVGMHISQLESLEKIEHVMTRIAKITRQGHDKFETRHRHKDGHDIDMEIAVTFLPEFQRFYVFCRDITERKQADNALRIAAMVFEAQEGILITDANNAILRTNQAFSNITGYTENELIGKNPNILSSGRQGADFYAAMWKSISETGLWDGEIWNRRKNGDIYPEHLTISSVKDPNGIVINYVATLTDITMSQAAADKIKYLAFYDPLTHLPNRLLLHDRLLLALVSSHRNDHHGALLFIDLDNFKNLNDTLGHDMGDVLLQQVAERLVTCVREGDTVARLGGDEFVVMLEDLSKAIDDAVVQVEVVGNKILAAFSQHYQLDTHYFHCTPSIGITLFKGQKQTVDELLKQADIAMYSAKASGRNTLRFFDQHMQDSIIHRMGLERDLALALAENQFTLYYRWRLTLTYTVVLGTKSTPESTKYDRLV